MEQDNRPEANWRQMLRLILASYVILIALGIVPYAAGNALAHLLVPENVASGMLSVGLFTAAYFILVGQRLRQASIVLLGIIILARIHLPAHGFQFVLLQDTLLIIGILLTGGWFAPKIQHIDAPGRICLTRTSLPSRPPKNSKTHVRTHAFAQSPDDMSRLFDQISEV